MTTLRPLSNTLHLKRNIARVAKETPKRNNCLHNPKQTPQHQFLSTFLYLPFLNQLSMPKQLGGHVYIMCNINNTTLYTGVSSNLPARVAQHKEKEYPNSFTAKYNCTKLVYYKWFDTIIEAIAEEKRIKGGSRKKKEILINSINPEWKDLYQETRFR